MQFTVLSVLLPLWIVYHTSAPRWSISLLVVLNTILVVLFQVRVGRNVKTVRDGGSALRVTGVLFLFSCAAMGLATGLAAPAVARWGERTRPLFMDAQSAGTESADTAEPADTAQPAKESVAVD